MPMTANDALRGGARGTNAEALAFARSRGANRLDQVEAYLDEVFRLAPRVGFDPAIVAAQSAEETGNWTSSWWVERLNPAGIGITGDPDENAASRFWESGTDAARAQIVHLFVYAVGDIEDGHTLFRFRSLDPRLGAALAAGFAGIARVIDDLSGRWADDPDYGVKIADRGNQIFPSLPNQARGAQPTGLNMTKGLIPMPPLIDHIVDVSRRCDEGWDPVHRRGRGYDFLGPRRIDALYVHRSQGTWTSNINSFDSFCPAALTDLQIDHEDGRMMRFVRLQPPHQSIDAPSGWANGSTVDQFGNLIAIGDALRLIQKHGGSGNAVNRFAESCEVTGFFDQPGDDPISDDARDTIARWFASRAHDYGIPWRSFPMIPDEGRSFIIGHRESRGGNAGDCPGDLLWSLIATPNADLIARARAIMKAAQETGHVDPDRPDENGHDPEFVRFGQRRVFHVRPNARATGREKPTRQSPIVQEFSAGTAIGCDGFFHGERIADEDRWLRTSGPKHLAIHASGVVESI